jgi:hypothetical protein
LFAKPLRQSKLRVLLELRFFEQKSAFLGYELGLRGARKRDPEISMEFLKKRDGRISGRQRLSV